MSVEVSSWAWKQKVGDPSAKLVLMKLADNADRTGYSWWGQKGLAEECEMSRSTLQRKLAKLESLGFLASVPRFRDEDGARTSNGYRLSSPPASNRSGGARSGDATPAHPGEAVTVNEPKTSSSSRKAGQLVGSVDGKIVVATEHDFAVAILNTFNEVSGRKFAGREHIRKIIMRIREHPELDLDGHERIMLRQFERPWWKGDPSPSVIYGNGAVFDRALNGVQAEPKADYSMYD